MTTAITAPEAPAPDESMSRSQAPGQSKPSFRLFFFTALSVLGCVLALASVATAATSSGQDQYVEHTPYGGGDSGGSDNAGGDGVEHNGQSPTGGGGAVDTGLDADQNGTLTEEEVKAEAERNKKRNAKKDDSDQGASGAVGAATGSASPPNPPAAQSVATSAKLGPLDRSTALILGGLILLGGLGVVAFGGGAGGTLGGAGGSSTPTANNQ